MSYKELIVWQKAMMLLEAIYRHMRSFPADERFRLCDQLSRAVVSVPSNIAEGFGRETDKDFRHFLSIARGSLYEIKTQLQLAESLGYLQVNSDVYALCDEVGKLINGLSRSLH